MNIKPSLQTRTRFNDYIENISFGHLRHDFSQVNVRQAASTIWAIIQLSARFSFITGFGGPDDREEATPLAAFVSSLGEDAEDMDPSSTTGAYRMCSSWEQLLHETVAEVDLCVRGGQIGSDYHLHLLDQAMEELITASAAECPSSHQRFYDYFLRDMFGSYHARYVWLKAQRVEVITSRSTPAKGMPSDSLKLPQWITENILWQLDDSRTIDFRVLDGEFQKTHWNDLGLFEKIACLVRDCLSDPLVEKPFDKLVGALDQFFSLFLAQRMVATEAELRGITRNPIAADPEGHLRDQLGTAPLGESPTPVERSLKSLQERYGVPSAATMEGESDTPPAPTGYDWLTAEADQEMVRPTSLTPEGVHAAEQANLQSVMRNLMRGFTRNGRLGADALEPNAFIAQTVKIFLGPTPASIHEQFERSVVHEPTLLRTSEVSDPAAKQLLSVEEQRKANREAEVTELLYAALPGDPVAEGFQEKFNTLRDQVLAEATAKGVTARRGLSDLVDRAVALYGTGFKKPRALTEQEIAVLEPVLWPLGRTTWGHEERVVYGLLEGKKWIIGSDLYSAEGIPLDINGAVPGLREEDGTLKSFGGTLDSLMGEWLHEQVVFALPGDANHMVPPAITLYQLPEADPIQAYTRRGQQLIEKGQLSGGILHFTGDTANLGELGVFHLFAPAPGGRDYILGGEISHRDSVGFDLLKCVVPTGNHLYAPVTEKLFGKVLEQGDTIGIPHDMLDGQFVLTLDTSRGVDRVTRNEISNHVLMHILTGHMSLETVGTLVEDVIANVGGLDKERTVLIAETERLIEVMHERHMADDQPAAATEQFEEGRLFRPEAATTYELVPAVTRRGMPQWQYAGHTYDLYSLKDGGQYTLFEPLYDSVGREIDMSPMIPVMLDDNHQARVARTDCGVPNGFSKPGNLLDEGVLALIDKPKEDQVGDVDYCILYVKRATVNKKQ